MHIILYIIHMWSLQVCRYEFGYVVCLLTCMVSNIYGCERSAYSTRCAYMQHVRSSVRGANRTTSANCMEAKQARTRAAETASAPACHALTAALDSGPGSVTCTDEWAPSPLCKLFAEGVSQGESARLRVCTSADPCGEVAHKPPNPSSQTPVVKLQYMAQTMVKCVNKSAMPLI